MPLARFYTRSLHDCLMLRRSWAGTVRLSRQALADLRWWRALGDPRHVRRAIWTPPTSATLHCDASDTGWGGVLDHARRLSPALGFWSPAEHSLHITHKELRAVRLTVAHFLPHLSGRHVRLHEDNTAVVSVLTHLTSRSPSLMHELRRLWYTLEAHDIRLAPTWIATAQNRLADAASRLAFPCDYVVSDAVWRQACSLWGTPTVDAFASPATAKSAHFWSRALCAGSAGVDAFAQQWRGEFVWAHPPPSLLPQLAHLLRDTPSAAAIVCTPCWTATSWFAELESLATQLLHLPADSLHRIAADAPARLEAWPLTLFLIIPRSPPPPLG